MFGTDIVALLSWHLNSHLATVLYETGIFLALLSGLRLLQNIVGNDRYSESLSMNIPKGLLPFPGAKDIILSTFSAISGSCSSVSVTLAGRSSTSHQLSLTSKLSFSLLGLSTSVVEYRFGKPQVFHCLQHFHEFENDQPVWQCFGQTHSTLHGHQTAKLCHLTMHVFCTSMPSLLNRALVSTRYFAASNTFCLTF